MPTTSAPIRNSNSTRLLFIYADGGALQDLNERLRTEEASTTDRRRLDFTQLPDMVVRRLREIDRVPAVESPKEGRIFFTLGATSASGFIEKVGTEWTVMTIPFGLCRYERSMPLDRADKDSRSLFKVRFHALISYHLGFLAGRAQGFSKPLTVAVISDDAQLLPAMADASHQNLDVRLVWPESSFPDETRYFAGRNGVKTMLVDPDVSSGPRVPSQVSYLDTLLKIGK
jgi:hypothetical protein